MVYAISEALLNYEKEKACTRKVAVCKPVRSSNIGPFRPDRPVSPSLTKAKRQVVTLQRGK
jgi:hypothetical protein